jgi:hypothetical protein
VQTFLPSRSFARSARLLDSRRLGKQRVEVLQILRALHLEDYGWRNHPAVCMWRGHTDALVSYGVEVTREWLRRGYADTVLGQLVEFAKRGTPRSQDELASSGLLPPWLGSARLHRSHRSALLRKDPSHYGRLFPGVPPDLPYFWPPSQAATADAVQERFSAWVVRPHAPGALRRFLTRGEVALPALDAASDGARGREPRTKGPRGETGGKPRSKEMRGERRSKEARGARLLPRPKSVRQVAAFRDAPQVGDAVVVPTGSDTLLVGEISGEYRKSPRAAAPHVRDVRWLETPLLRGALELPGRLQDPRYFFVLRGEHDPRDILAAYASEPRTPRRRRAG